MSVYRDYGFPLTSVEGDRTYGSADWRKYFSSLVTNGVIAGIGDELEVVASSPAAKSVVVSTGAALVDGAIREIEAAHTLSLSDNTSGSTRVDRIVARYNDGDRIVEFAVVEGTPGAGAPTIDSNEISLAQVSLANGYSTVVAGDITDERDSEDSPGRVIFRSTFATQAEAEAAALANVFMSPLGTKQQIDARRASQEQAEAGTSEDVIMNPLRTKQQVDARIASQEQAEAGTDNINIMTALRTVQAVEALGIPQFETGSYTGTGSSHTVSVGFDPLLVVVGSNDRTHIVLGTRNGLILGGQNMAYSTAVKNATGGFTVGSNSDGANVSGTTYEWVAIG